MTHTESKSSRQLLAECHMACELLRSELKVGETLEQFPLACLEPRTSDVKQILQALQQWQKSLMVLGAAVADFREVVPQWRYSPAALQVLPQSLAVVSTLEPPDDDVMWQYMPQLFGETLSQWRMMIDEFLQLGTWIVRLTKHITHWQVEDSQLANRHAQAARVFNQYVEREVSIADFGELLDELMWFGEWSKYAPLEFIEDIISSLSTSDHCLTTQSFVGLRQLRAFLSLVMSLPVSLLNIREDCQMAPSFSSAAEALESSLQSIRERRAQLGQWFDLEMLDLPAARRLQQQFVQAEGLAWPNRGYRQAKRQLQELVVDGATIDIAIEKLPSLIDLLVEIEVLNTDQATARALGGLYQGEQTSTETIAKLLDWQAEVQQKMGRDMLCALMELPSQSTLLLRKCFQKHGNALARVEQLHARISGGFQEHVLHDLDKARIADEKSYLHKLCSELQHAVEISKEFNFQSGCSMSQLIGDLAMHEELLKSYAGWVELREKNQVFPGLEMELNPSLSFEPMLCKAMLTLDYAESLTRIPCMLIQASARENAGQQWFGRLQEAGKRLLNAQLIERAASKAFFNLVGADRAIWSARITLPGKTVLARNQVLLKKPHLLDHWVRFKRTKSELDARGYGALAMQLANDVISLDDALAYLDA